MRARTSAKGALLGLAVVGLAMAGPCSGALAQAPSSPAPSSPAPSSARPRSPALRAVQDAYASRLAAVRAAAPPLVTDAPEGGRAVQLGRRYTERVVRRVPRGADERARVLAILRRQLRPDPTDFVWHEGAALFVSPEAASVAEAFDGPTASPRGPAERGALAALAEALCAAVAAQPTLKLYAVSGGWADVNGGAFYGVVVLDAARGEALWVYSDETWGE